MNQKKYWQTPAGQYYEINAEMLRQPHLLIAGSTGSGKSVLINTLIYTLLYASPNNCNFLLIDPKRVELVDYKDLPHCIGYASEPLDIAHMLKQITQRMDDRYTRMQAARLKKSEEVPTYIIIDEFADLMTTQKRIVLPYLQRLAQLGRAANMHLILATQRPTKDVVNGQVKVNMDSRVALRCPTAQDSRNIIERSGAENLPRYGQGILVTPDRYRPTLFDVHMTPPEELAARIEWWMKQYKETFPKEYTAQNANKEQAEETKSRQKKHRFLFWKK